MQASAQSPIDYAIEEIQQRYVSGSVPLAPGLGDGAVLVALARPDAQGHTQSGCMWAPNETAAGLASAQAMRQGFAAGTAMRLRVNAQGAITREYPSRNPDDLISPACPPRIAAQQRPVVGV